MDKGLVERAMPTNPTDAQEAVALEPCPFCGAAAKIEAHRYQGVGGSGMETPEPFAACTTKGCARMAPVRCDDWPHGRKLGLPTGAEARKIAIAAWNTRALARQQVPSEECVERVARAITAEFERGSPDLAADLRMDWEAWAPEARAAIKAIADSSSA